MNEHTISGGRRARGLGPRRTADAPLVSVLTVVYNGAATIERTIQSVLAQTHPSIEYVVVDGGSTDGTLDILRRYDDRIDHWTSGRDKGIYDAMNKGIALCTGEWVGMINADDAYLPATVALAMGAVRPHTTIVHGDIWIEYPNGTRKVKRARPNGFLLRHWEMTLNHPSFFVRRAYYAEHPYTTRLKVGGDHHWTLRAWMEDPRVFTYVPEPLALFSTGGASMTIPLSRTLKEGDALSRELGLGAVHRWTGRAVRVLMYLPQKVKLFLNQFVPPLAADRSR